MNHHHHLPKLALSHATSNRKIWLLELPRSIWLDGKKRFRRLNGLWDIIDGCRHLGRGSIVEDLYSLLVIVVADVLIEIYLLFLEEAIYLHFRAFLQAYIRSDHFLSFGFIYCLKLTIYLSRFCFWVWFVLLRKGGGLLCGQGVKGLCLVSSGELKVRSLFLFFFRIASKGMLEFTIEKFKFLLQSYDLSFSSFLACLLISLTHSLSLALFAEFSA